MQAAAAERRLRHARPSIGAGEYDYSQRDLRWTRRASARSSSDKEFADHNKQLMQGWLSHWVPQAWRRRGRCSRCGRQPDHKPPRFEDSLDRAKNRFAGIVPDLGLDTPEELKQ